MKLVLKNDKVIATHDDFQNITTAMYPDCIIKIAPDGTIVNYETGDYTLPEGGSLSDVVVYVSKLKIVDRLEAIGKRSAVKAALAQNEYALDRWNAAQEIANDDANVIGLFQVCGLTSEEIAAVLA